MAQVMPHDRAAELAVLGSILLDSSTLDEVWDCCPPELFYEPRNGALLQAMMDLRAAGKPIDTVTLHDEMQKKGPAVITGGPALLVEASATVATGANAKYYADIVAGKAMLRDVVRAGQEMIDIGLSEQDPESARAQAEHLLLGAKRAKRSSVRTANEVVIECFQAIERQAQAKTDLTGLPTGLREFDRVTSGLQPTDLIIVAGRPGMGKSALAKDWSAHASIKCGKPSLTFSLEMSRDQWMRRNLSSEAMVDGQKIKTGRLSSDDWVRLAKTASAVSGSQMFVDDTGALRLADCMSRARRLAIELGGLSLVVVDYIQLMRAGNRHRDGNREQEIAEISRGLKALAKELECPVVGLSQLNRGLENRADKRPLLSDLRESGAIEQDADLVVFVYRDEYYNQGSPPEEAELIIGKHRNGPICTVKVGWDGKHTKFHDAQIQDSSAPVARAGGSVRHEWRADYGEAEHGDDA